MQMLEIFLLYFYLIPDFTQRKHYLMTYGRTWYVTENIYNVLWLDSFLKFMRDVAVKIHSLNIGNRSSYINFDNTYMVENSAMSAIIGKSFYNKKSLLQPQFSYLK